MRRGFFITFEGVDGSGKTTQINLLKTFLADHGYEAVITREPGGTRVSEILRDIVLDKEYREISPKTEALLYAAARAQHTDEVIRPALDAGKTVISDRYVDSSIAYQGYGRKLGEPVEIINAFAIGDCIPDVTFLLKIDPAIGIGRISASEADRIEQEKLSYHQAVHEGFLDLERRFPERITGIDASKPANEIHEQIRGRIEKLINGAVQRK